MKLPDISIHAWMKENGIKTEKGEPVTFKDHMFLFDIYNDFSPLQAIMKPAQIGASTMMNVKPFWLMDKLGVDIIYTLPTDSDVVDFVGSKTNRIIAQNPIFQRLTEDRNTIEQKQVGKAVIYYRGTFTKKAAMMVPADVLIHDEVDASKLDVISDYESRVKHSKYKWRWYFSHPSTEGAGVHSYFLKSDQKHWFIRCSHCSFEQYLSWPDSVDIERECFKCKKCGGELSDNDRRKGRWVNKYSDKEYSGYWISSLMCPWVSAREIIKNYNEKDPEYFYTKVLGLPYVGGGNKLMREQLFANINKGVNKQDGRIVIGVDTGAHVHLVCGNKEGLFYYSESSDYEELERLMARWPRATVVMDQGGDLVLPRKLREKYPGRVFLCHFRADRKTMQLVKWGEGPEYGNVIADRNRMIQLVVDEYVDKRIPLFGTEHDWEPYFGHWSNMYRTREEDSLGVMRNKWERTGPDHWALATVYWRVGMNRFGMGEGDVLTQTPVIPVQRGVEVTPDDTVPSKPYKHIILNLPDPYDDSNPFR